MFLVVVLENKKKEHRLSDCKVFSVIIRVPPKVLKTGDIPIVILRFTTSYAYCCINDDYNKYILSDFSSKMLNKCLTKTTINWF